MPMISIIVPVYQAKEYLEKCINSICKQSFSDFELILVDDGSDDGSEKTCDEYATKDDRIIVIHQSNQGVSSARNAGLDCAAGKYVTFIDADDWIDYNFLKESMEKLEKKSCDILYHGFMKEIWKDGEKKSLAKGKPVIEGIVSRKQMKQYIVKEKGKINDNVFSYVFNKKLVEDVFFEKTMPYAEDAVFVMQVLAKANTYFFDKTCGYHYNVRLGSAAYRWQPNLVECYSKSFEEARCFFEGLEISKRDVDEIMAVKIIDGYASLIYNLCLPTCNLKINEKMKILKQARKQFQVDKCKKIYKISQKNSFEKIKTILTFCRLEIILILFGPLYCRRG